MKIVVIQSGSKGNATLVIEGKSVLLIDMGISLSSLKEGLSLFNLKFFDIDALLLTHDHSDHTKGIKYLDPLPIYCGEEVYDGENVNFVKPLHSFSIKDFTITPVRASHDAHNPLGFIIETKNEKLVYLTDTGKILKTTLSKIGNADYYVIESNHDVQMLYDTDRPMCLVNRILSDKGHLSNVQSANYMVKLIGPKTKQIILAHLSEEANTPEKALETYKLIFEDIGLSLKGIDLRCASQNKITIAGKIE